jgi:hypothetical protein
MSNCQRLVVPTLFLDSLRPGNKLVQGSHVDDHPVIDIRVIPPLQSDPDLLLEIKQIVNKVPGFVDLLFKRPLSLAFLG